MKPTKQILLLALSVMTWTAPSWSSQMASVDAIIENTPQTVVTAGRDVVLTATEVEQNVSAGRDVHGSSCSVGNNLTAGRDTQLSACSVKGSLETGRALRINHSSIAGHAIIGGNASLVHSNLFGPVTVGGEVVVDHSTLSQALSVSDSHLMVFDSHLTDIYVKRQSQNLTTHLNGVSIQSTHGSHSVIQVGPGSQSLVNGYTVRSTEQATVVITPSLSIYENGQLRSGDGAKTYAQYMSQNPQAPAITGPGWSIQNAQSPTEGTVEPETIEILGDTVVSGNIVFESGLGKVLLHPPAKITGTVTGGKVIPVNH